MNELNAGIDLAGDLVQMRDRMRRIMGTRYEAQVRDYRDVLRGLAKETGVPLAKAALQLCEELIREGHATSMMMCAFVDEAESTVAAAK